MWVELVEHGQGDHDGQREHPDTQDGRPGGARRDLGVTRVADGKVSEICGE